jgi:hypothetical protein
MHNLSLLVVADPSTAPAPELQSLASVLELPRLDPRTTTLPEPSAMVRWRREADVRLEAALAGFDDDIVRDRPAMPAARRCVEEVMGWIRESVCGFTTPSGSDLISGQLRRKEAARWDALADRAVQEAAEDPDGVERCLRLYVGLAHEVTARGFASLVASTGP